MEPLRTCIGCTSRKPQSELLRISMDRSGRITVDEGVHSPGRGAYICRNEECVDRAIAKKRFNRAFRTEVKPEAYEFIRKRIRIEG